MKIKKTLLFFGFCLVSALSLFSCQNDDAIDDSDIVQPEPLTLETRVGAVLSTSAAVQIIPSSEEGKYYLHLFTDSEFQAVQGELDKTMADLIATNPDKSLQGGQTLIFDKLEVATDYVACLVPSNYAQDEKKTM